MSTVHRTACPLQLTSVLHALTDIQPGLLAAFLTSWRLPAGSYAVACACVHPAAHQQHESDMLLNHKS